MPKKTLNFLTALPKSFFCKMLNNKSELTNWAQNKKQKNTNWHQNSSQKSSKNPIFVVRKWAPQEVVLFLTLEVVPNRQNVVPKLTLQHIYIYIYIQMLGSQLVVHLFPSSRPAGCPHPSQLVVHLLFRTIKIGVSGHRHVVTPRCGFDEIYGSGSARLVTLHVLTYWEVKKKPWCAQGLFFYFQLFAFLG